MKKTVVQEYLKYLITEEKDYQIFQGDKQTMEIVSTIFKRLKNKAEFMMEEEKEMLRDAYFTGYISDDLEFDEYYKETFNTNDYE